MDRVSNFLWGVVFVVVGVVFGLNAMDITDIDIFFDGWWTLFIIVPSFIGLFDTKDDDKMGNLIGLFIGVFLLFGCLDLISFGLIWKLMVPAILVGIGLSFMFKGTIINGISKKIKMGDREYCAIFGSQNLDFSKEKFEGCTLTSVFGSVKCDLRDAKITDDVKIKVNSIFGGVVILMPNDVKVRVNSIPIFGGVSNNAMKIDKDNAKTIYVDATSMFGGVDIR